MHFIQGLLTLMALGASVVTAASLKERQATPPPPQVGAVVGGTCNLPNQACTLSTGPVVQCHTSAPCKGTGNGCTGYPWAEAECT
ncbi:hypothetical protein MYU51_001441 [Penicillium brevicompactum]